ncbi:MAG TPA: ATP-binding protein [Pyrinomonadaceae bacterium]|jgi:PAS domain S-box-containing protein
MLKEILSVAGRYGLALGAFALVLLTTITISRLFSFSLDLTSLIIAVMIASAWYLGRGPGLIVAIVFEITLIYFATAPYTAKSAFITFNRLVLFVTLVLFASSRRQAEKHLREQREWLRVSLASIGDAVIATDVNGCVNFINPTAETLTGWSSAEAEKKSFDGVFKIINEDTNEPVESPFATVMRLENVIELSNHVSLKTKDNRTIPIENSGSPIKDAHGKIIGVIVVFHDVSERRRAARERERLLESERHARSEAESANRLKDEFLATVSHELRTPLNAILGWSALLNRGNLEEEAKITALEVIERNAKAQAEIISDILDVSRIITGKLRIKAEPIEPAQIIEAAIETLRPAIDAKAIDLQVSHAENAGFVSGDADRLQQIIWNLLSNAIKFTPEKGRIEVDLKRDNSHLEITVCDNGIGIEPEFLPHVFERFRQADSSTTRVHSGLGLGLAIVRYLVELHGGEVRAESPGIGKGATFTIVLPIAAEPATPTLPANGLSGKNKETNSSVKKTDLTGLRVLVVDDEPDTLEILRAALTSYGANVRTAISASLALETFLVWKPNVLISDLGMPNEDGYSLIRKIRALKPEEGGVPAAALTAYVREEDRLRALDAGFQTHIPKPVDPDKLAAEVASLAEQNPIITV